MLLRGRVLWILVVAGWLAAAQPVAAQTALPDNRSLLLLVRDTLMALDQANRTGNYGVFRELGTPSFINANTEARLAEIFSTQRQTNFDMRLASVLGPITTQTPRVDDNNRLRLTGYFDTRPMRISFDLAFELVAGEWKLFGLAVNPVAPEENTTQQEPESTADTPLPPLPMAQPAQ